MNRDSANVVGYQLLDALPHNVMEMKLPGFRVNLCDLFKWRSWQALGWVRISFYILMVIYSIVFAVWLLIALFSGALAAILGMIFLPLIYLLFVAGLRIIIEFIVAVLIIPHQLFALTMEVKRLRMAMQQRAQRGPQVQAVNLNAAPNNGRMGAFSDIRMEGPSSSAMTAPVAMGHSAIPMMVAPIGIEMVSPAVAVSQQRASSQNQINPYAE